MIASRSSGGTVGVLGSATGRPFECSRPRPGLVVVRGEVDLATADQLAQVLGDACAEGTDVEVDLTETTFFDSSGFQAVVRALRELGPDCGLNLVVRTPGIVDRALELLGIETMPGLTVRRVART